MKKITLKQQTSSRNALRSLSAQEIELVRGGDGTDTRAVVIDTGKNVRRH